MFLTAVGWYNPVFGVWLLDHFITCDVLIYVLHKLSVLPFDLDIKQAETM